MTLQRLILTFKPDFIALERQVKETDKLAAEIED